MNRTASLALVLLLVVSAMLVFVAAMPTVKAAVTSKYYVESAVGCADGFGNHAWDNTLCWSLTSGGATGAGVPGPTENAVFDSNSRSGGGAGSYSPQITDETMTINDLISDHAGSGSIILQTPNLNPSATAILSIHSFIGTFDGTGADILYIGQFGDQGTSTLKFSGTIETNLANPDCWTAAIIGGVCLYGNAPSPDSRSLYIEYTGLNAFGTASNVGFTDSTAATKTVYCDPGCVDSGENTNIIFGPAPAPPATGGGPAPTTTPPSTAPPTFLESTVAVGVILLVAGAVVTYLGMVMKSPLIRKGALVLLIAGALVLVIAVFLA